MDVVMLEPETVGLRDELVGEEVDIWLVVELADTSKSCRRKSKDFQTRD